MKKLLSISLSILMIMALFVPLSLITVSAEDAISTSDYQVWNFENDVFGAGFCSTQPGPNAGDTTSVVWNGAAGGWGCNKKLTDIENGVYVFTFDVISSGGTGTAKVGLNDGSERFINALSYTEWTTISVMAKVTNNSLYYGLIWYGGNNAGTWVRIDNMKLERVTVLEHTGYNVGSSSDIKYVTDSSIGADIAAGGNGMLLKKRLVLEPYTTYTMYVPIYNNGMNGTLSVFSSNNSSDTFIDDGGKSYDGTASVSLADSTSTWIVRKVNFTTGLTGVVWLKSWLTNGNGTAAAAKLRISGLSVVKHDKADGYLPISAFTKNDARFTIQDGGFVTGQEAVLTTSGQNFFAPTLKHLDGGFYVISAYVKVSADASIEWWGGNGSDINTGRYTNVYNLEADAGWQYISSQFYITDTTAHYGWWIPALSEETTFTFDGFKLEKLTEVSVESAFKYWKSAPERFTRTQALGYNSQIKINHENGNSATGTITLEPDTEYVMYYNRNTVVKGGDITISSGENSSKLSVKPTSGWVTEQVKFKTDSTGVAKIFIWSGAGGTNKYDGFAYRKVTEAAFDEVLAEPDIDVAGSEKVTNAVTGVVEIKTIAALVRGDATGDGVRDILDIIRLKKYLADKENTVVSEKACFVMGGEEITIDDVTGLRKLLMGLTL